MTGKARAAMRKIFQETAARHGLSEADLYVRDRRSSYAIARHDAWDKCCKAGFIRADIVLLGGWDWTTVDHGVKQHRARPK